MFFFYINDKTFYLASETIFEKLNFCCRAFSAYEDGCLVDSDIEHRERLLLQEYKQKFMQLSLSDPLVIKEGWIGENVGENVVVAEIIFYGYFELFLSSGVSRKLMAAIRVRV